MRLIDSRPLGGGSRITLDQIRAAGTRYASNPIALATFAAGITPHPDLLLDEQLARSVGASGKHAFFDYVMHEVLPEIYSAPHLAALGGRFAIQLPGVATYTLTLLNRRIVTLRGLPVDQQNRPIADTVVRADAFLALFNQMLADLAAQTLRTQSSLTTAA